LYRLDTNPAKFQVYEGRALIRSQSGDLELKRGNFDGAVSVFQRDAVALQQLVVGSLLRSLHVYSGRRLFLCFVRENCG
jgi:hypothetical protein